VLAFERRDHPIARATHDFFRLRHNTRIVLEATPQDLRECVDDGFEEIVAIIHSIQMDESGERVNLGYFREIKGYDRSDYLDHQATALRRRLAELDRQGRVNRAEIARLTRQLRRIEGFNSSTPLYGPPLIIFNRFFQSLERVIADQHQQGVLRLKKFRLMSCARELIQERYSFFGNLEQFGIEFDAAPASPFWSAVNGRSVTNFDRAWLRRSL
jgi:hypothetical protein